MGYLLPIMLFCMLALFADIGERGMGGFVTLWLDSDCVLNRIWPATRLVQTSAAV